ncbi:MAG: prepilin peptidase [Gemmobacter sp.]
MILPDLPAADHPVPVVVFATVVLSGLLVAIARADLRTLRIPDGLSLMLALAGLALAAMGPRLPDHLVGAVVGYGLFWAIGAVHFRRTGREGLGLGDAKLFGGAGAWLGWQALPFVLLIAAAGGLAAALVQRSRGGGAEVAFGPWLALGLWAMWVRAAVIG